MKLHKAKYVVNSDKHLVITSRSTELTVIDEIQLTEISVSQQSNWNLVGLPVTVSNPNYARIPAI